MQGHRQPETPGDPRNKQGTTLATTQSPGRARATPSQQPPPLHSGHRAWHRACPRCQAVQAAPSSRASSLIRREATLSPRPGLKSRCRSCPHPGLQVPCRTSLPCWTAMASCTHPTQRCLEQTVTPPAWTGEFVPGQFRENQGPSTRALELICKLYCGPSVLLELIRLVRKTITWHMIL